METKAVVLVRVMAVMIALPFVFMIGRFYARLKYSGKLGWDDAVLILSWVCKQLLWIKQLMAPGLHF
jgi:hypothetical protein